MFRTHIDEQTTRHQLYQKTRLFWSHVWSRAGNPPSSPLRQTFDVVDHPYIIELRTYDALER